MSSFWRQHLLWMEEVHAVYTYLRTYAFGIAILQTQLAREVESVSCTTVPGEVCCLLAVSGT